ncbi:MAG TPA: 5-oxoprolinase subunit PxpA [Victivallales bacterium]|nr:5-oxoprolinase subunit PxpA [Victivallales bacterium]
MRKIDINSDLGESYGHYNIGEVDGILNCISSVNIACGYHAGDHNVMDETVIKAKKYGVSIGAHPGFNDLFGFGRRLLPSSSKEIYNMIIYQIGALNSFCMINDVKMNHVKPHGALYNFASVNRETAKAIADAVHDFNSDLILYGLCGSLLIEEAEKKGIKTANEVFADRNYMDDGTLTPRSMKNAMITDEKQAIERVLKMILDKQVLSINNKVISIKPDTVCIHGDSSNALLFAESLKKELIKNKIEIKPPYLD